MKKLLSLVCLLMGVVSLSAQQLPDVKIENAQGKIVPVRSIAKGKPMIISYWSITCKPCIQELNAINDALEEWREEADFEVVAISTDDARMKASAKTIASSRGWDFICLYDDKQTLKRAMNVSLTPQSFVVDANGKVVFSHSGYTPGSEQLLFDKILELKKKKFVSISLVRKVQICLLEKATKWLVTILISSKNQHLKMRNDFRIDCSRISQLVRSEKSMLHIQSLKIQ